MTATQTTLAAKPAKATLALAPITPAQAVKAAGALAAAAGKREGADTTFLAGVVAAVEGLPPMNAAQYAKQLAPSVRDALKRKLKGKPETTVASYASRFKTLTLALCCGDASLQPIAGEGYVAFLTRAAEGVAKGKLPDGSAIWPSDVAKPGRAAGTKAAKGAPPVGGQTSGALSPHLTGNTGGEAGLNVRPVLAAAMIVCGGNAARAQRLVVAVENYPAEFDKWLSAILSDDDKAKLSKLASVATAGDAAKAAATPKGATPVAETAMAAAMVKAAAPRNGRKGQKAA